MRRAGGGSATAAGAEISVLLGSDVEDGERSPFPEDCRELTPHARSRTFSRHPQHALPRGWSQLPATCTNQELTIVQHFLTIAISLAFLVNIIGVAAFAGVATLLLAMPIQTRVGRLLAKYQTRLRKASDARIALATEVIHGIRLVKAEAWEEHLKAKMEVRRRAELRAIWTKYMTVIVSDMVSGGIPVAVAVSSFQIAFWIKSVADCRCTGRDLRRPHQRSSYTYPLRILADTDFSIKSFIAVLTPRLPSRASQIGRAHV